jgi:outer membrane autotransporter protein
MGNGTMASLILEGTIAPGNSIGTQTILGNYTMTPTSTYEAEVDPNGTSDFIDVGGTATLGGTLDVISDKPRQALKSTPYTILTANRGVIGKFASTISSNRVKYTVQYLPNTVRILTAAHQDFVDLFGLADPSNAARTGRYLDTFADTVPTTSDLGQIIQLLDGMLLTGNVAGLTNALDQIQPSQYRETGLLSFLSSELVEKNVQLQQQYLRETHHLEGELRKLDGVSSKRAASFYKLVNDTLSKGFNFARIQENRVGPKKSLLSFLAPHGAEGSGMPGSQRIRLGQSSVWFQSYGQIHEKNSSNGNVGLRSQTGGFSLGADHEIMPNTFVGLFGGLSTTPFKWKSARGNGHMNSYYGGLYGTWMSRGLYVDGQVIAGQDRYRSNRTINFAGINRSATESHYGNQFSVDTEIGYACDMPVVTVQPYVGASYMVVRENGYTESGANGLNFSIKPKTSQFARGAIGAQFYRTFVCGETLLRPALQLAFVRKQPIGSSPADLNGGFVNQPQTLTVLGDNKARNQFAPGISLTTQFRNGAYLIANVSGQVFSGQNSGEALLKVGYDF